MPVALNNCRYNPSAGGTTDWTYSSDVTGYQNPANAGAVNSRVYEYLAISTSGTEWEIGRGPYNTGTGVLARTTVLYNSSATGTAAGQSGAGTKINFAAAPQVAIVVITSTAMTIQVLTSGSGATYNTPAGCKRIRVKAVGGGGGGAGTTNGTTGVIVAGSDGGDSTFNSVVAKGGKGAGGAVTAIPSAAGAGGTGGTGTASRRIPGGAGGIGAIAASVNTPTGFGGNSFFSGGLSSLVTNPVAGTSGAANSGVGGTGANSGSSTNVLGGGGGGGEGFELVIDNPASSYTYTVGAAGAGGVGGNQTGGAGGSGGFIVEEEYGWVA